MSSRMVMRSALETAHDYAALGLAVFPVGWDCRTPLCEHGCKEASADPEAIDRLWAGRSSTNVSLATGAISGVFALDVDAKDGKDGFAALAELEARHSPLPRSWRSHTPSGGAHLFFAQPGGRRLRNRVNLPVYGVAKSGLDVRADGGSVALPPSRKSSGAYVWEVDPVAGVLAAAPDWLLELIDPPTPILPPASPVRLSTTDRMAAYVVAAVNAECGELARLDRGAGRNLRLFQGAANLGEFVGAGLLSRRSAEAALERAAIECGLVGEDGIRSVQASIASGMARGIAHPRKVSA